MPGAGQTERNVSSGHVFLSRFSFFHFPSCYFLFAHFLFTGPPNGKRAGRSGRRCQSQNKHARVTKAYSDLTLLSATPAHFALTQLFSLFFPLSTLFVFSFLLLFTQTRAVPELHTNRVKQCANWNGYFQVWLSWKSS